jgi:hypothetical protein
MMDIIINLAIFYNRHFELDNYRQLCCIANIIITLAVSYYRHSGSSDWLMVIDATFNNISVISWPSVLLVEKT